MGDFDLNLIRESLKSQDFITARDQYFNVIHAQSDENLLAILEGIRDLITNGIELTLPQLSQIKEYFDCYGESIQDSAIEIYLHILRNSPELLAQEIIYCQEQVKNFDPIIRAKFIDFLIEMFTTNPELNVVIFLTLKDCMNDEQWKTRLKLVEFFRTTLQCQPDFIAQYNKDFLILLYEPDFDVLAEIIDFLYKLIDVTFTSEDMAFLISSISKNEWIAQEHSIWLLEKLGVQKPGLIQNYLMEILKLLDHDDIMVQKRISKAIDTIMDAHLAFFDDVIFNAINQETVDDMDELENLLKGSVENKGAKRFLYLFEKYAITTPKNIIIFSDILRAIESSNSELAEKIVTEVTLYVRQALPSHAKFFQQLLQRVQHFNLYLVVYLLLSEDSYLIPEDHFSFRDSLLDFLTATIPEVGYHRLAEWIKNRLTTGPIGFEELCQRFNLQESKLLDILKAILAQGLLDAVISEDTIQNPVAVEETTGSLEDIAIAKKWEIDSDPETNQPRIQFHVKIENVSGKPITTLNVILVNPHDILLDNDADKPMIQFKDYLDPNESLIISWSFYKKSELVDPIASFIKITFLYQKDGKISSITKRLEILAL